jgi:hypothetical protein
MQMLPLQTGLVPLHDPPHLIVPPQTLSIVPQLAPNGQRLLVQPQTFGVPGLPPPQVAGSLQSLPQLIIPPHLLAMEPQLAPTGQVLLVQPQTPGVPGLPPPQVSGDVQSVLLQHS